MLDRPLPRISLTLTCLGHAAVFAWAAAVLPWRSGTAFALVLSLLALLHVATAVTALSKRPAWLIWVWRALAAASLLAFLSVGWSMAAAALYVGKLYLRLGPSVATGIAVAAIVLGLLTVPMSVWALRYTWPTQGRWGRRIGLGGSLLLTLALFTLPVVSKAAPAEAVPLADARVTSDISSVLEEHLQSEPRGERLTVAGSGSVQCEQPITPERLTVLMAYVPLRRGGARSVCLQASSPAQLQAAVRRQVLRRARPGSTLVLDLVKAVKPLNATFPLLDALEVRPGLDGVCEGTRCLAAWQLTLADIFSENHPLPSMPDVSYGFSTEGVRRALNVPKAQRGHGIDGLVRIETESFVADERGVHRLQRTRTTPPALSRHGVEQAVTAAQRYIIGAQEEDGSFRYSLDPVSGTEDKATLNLPRQAGTTYALCELGHGPGVRATIKRALSVFASRETTLAEISALQDNGVFGLGKSALPLLSMLRCRDIAGPENDRLVGQLARLMLRLQRENGSFFPELDAKTAKGKGEHEVLYAAGQGVLSLILLEQRYDQLTGSAAEPLPKKAALKSAIDRAMAFYGGPYWPKPLRDFFFFEEGWHCLAARHALSSHRNDAYEQLCIDYVASRGRYVARQSDTAEPNFVGGYGLDDMFPPRNTATSGFGEALNAAIAIKQLRGMPVEADKALLRDVVSFLLRAQWSESGCYACAKPELVIGGFSQQIAAPDIRIDYVQHAMSAIGQGGRLLFD